LRVLLQGFILETQVSKTAALSMMSAPLYPRGVEFTPK